MALGSPPHPFTRLPSTGATAIWNAALAVVVGCAFAFAAGAEEDGTLQTDAAALRAVARSNPVFNRSWVDADPCLWTGVQCNNSRVTALSLDALSLDAQSFVESFDLSGPIPKELANLTSLRNLSLCFSGLSGPIPAELGGLKSLQFLDISFNMFLTGPIPKELGNLASLQSLRISFNHKLSGQIPEDLGNLTSLTGLELTNNGLSGPIPEDLGRLTSLQLLHLSGNNFSGPIPSKLGSLRSLKLLMLSNNQLSGAIPRELSGLESLKLLDLSSNQLSGPIPKELASLSCLGLLYLSSNRLSGPIPKEFGNFSSLYSLTLSNNELSGRIPGEIGSLTTLGVLNLSSNLLRGPIPKQLRRLCSAKIDLGCMDDLSTADLEYVCKALPKNGGPDFIVGDSCRHNCPPASPTMFAAVAWRVWSGLTAFLVIITPIFGSETCRPSVNEQPAVNHRNITATGWRKYAWELFSLAVISLDVITILQSTHYPVELWSLLVLSFFCVWPPGGEQSVDVTSAVGFCKYAWGLLSLGFVVLDCVINFQVLMHQAGSWNSTVSFFLLAWKGFLGAIMFCWYCQRKHCWPLFPLWD